MIASSQYTAGAQYVLLLCRWVGRKTELGRIQGLRYHQQSGVFLLSLLTSSFSLCPCVCVGGGTHVPICPRHTVIIQLTGDRDMGGKCTSCDQVSPHWGAHFSWCLLPQLGVQPLPSGLAVCLALSSWDFCPRP